MPRLELFPFRYRDGLTGQWVRARYHAERHEISKRYADTDWEISGPPEIRDVDPNDRYLSPFGTLNPHAELKRTAEKQAHLLPEIDDRERFLVGVFLRRYVTYCARAKRYAQMEGPARLLKVYGVTAPTV